MGTRSLTYFYEEEVSDSMCPTFYLSNEQMLGISNQLNGTHLTKDNIIIALKLLSNYNEVLLHKMGFSNDCNQLLSRLLCQTSPYLKTPILLLEIFKRSNCVKFLSMVLT